MQTITCLLFFFAGIGIGCFITFMIVSVVVQKGIVENRKEIARIELETKRETHAE